MTTPMNPNRYAKHRGVKPGSVRAAIKSGTLSRSVTFTDTGTPMIDPEIADREWITREDARGVPAYTAKAGDGRLSTDWQKVAGEAPLLAESKAKREAAEAELAELKLAQAQGKLVEADQVKDTAFKVARTVRDSMMNIPDRVATEFAAETDSFKIHQRLTEEIRKALETLKVE